MVKIIKDYYHGDNFYNKDIYGNYEDDIIKYINDYDVKNYREIIEQDKRTNIVHVFSEMRANIIKWYPFDKEKSVLEVGANYGEITQELVKKVDNVTSIEFTNKKVEAIEKRLKTNNQLEVIKCTKLSDVKLSKKYDYIIMIGIAEYAKKLGFLNIEEMINWAFSNLEEDGTILLAIDNKFGVKYLAGSTRNAEEVPFANYKPYITKEYKLYGRGELITKLERNNIDYKFYYPLPNYNLTHLIYTDSFLPNKGDYNIYYREDEEIMYNELDFVSEAVKNKEFTNITNSFLIELRNKGLGIDTNVNFVKYSNMRKKDYKIITKIHSNGVTKESYSDEGTQHIEKIGNNIERLKELGFTVYEKKEDKIISDFINKPTMDEYLAKLIKDNKIDQFYQELYNWEKLLKEKLKESNEKTTVFEKYDISIPHGVENRLTIVKDGFIDLIFQNVFYDGEGEYVVFDQEWIEENIPLEFIIYRSIKQLFAKYKFISEIINKEEIYKKYNLASYIDVFEEIENKWQEKIVDKEVLDFYSQKWSRIISIEDIKFKYNQELGKIYEERDNLEKENKKLKNEIEVLKNGRLYKLSQRLNRRKNNG